MFGRLSTGSQGGRSLDAQKIEQAYVGYHTLFHDRLAKAMAVASRIATIVTTTEVVDRQIWLSNNPKMRRWVGDKHLHKLRAQSHPIMTEPHEASVEVPKNDILNDRFGLYASRISGMAEAYSWRLDEFVFGQLVAGVQGTAYGACYDGQNLLDDDHTALSNDSAGGNQSNLVDGALDEDTYAEAWMKFLSFRDENGTPLNTAARPMTLVCGPANREAARLIIQQGINVAGAENIDRGTASLLVTGWINEGSKFNLNGTEVEATGLEWFLLPADSAAVLVHVKRAPEFLAVEEGDAAFMTGKYKYGIEAELGSANGLWQEVVGGPGE